MNDLAQGRLGRDDIGTADIEGTVAEVVAEESPEPWWAKRMLESITEPPGATTLPDLRGLTLADHQDPLTFLDRWRVNNRDGARRLAYASVRLRTAGVTGRRAATRHRSVGASGLRHTRFSFRVMSQRCDGFALTVDHPDLPIKPVSAA